jgi:hypothetical protein
VLKQTNKNVKNNSSPGSNKIAMSQQAEEQAGCHISKYFWPITKKNFFLFTLF